MEEEYTIGIASGFQVSGKDYYSRNFTTLKEAEEHKKMLESTPKVEKTVVKSYQPKEEKKNVKK
jgi:dsDNA-binding SOS-regulon protein